MTDTLPPFTPEGELGLPVITHEGDPTLAQITEANEGTETAIRAADAHVLALHGSLRGSEEQGHAQTLFEDRGLQFQTRARKALEGPRQGKRSPLLETVPGTLHH